MEERPTSSPATRCFRHDGWQAIISVEKTPLDADYVHLSVSGVTRGDAVDDKAVQEAMSMLTRAGIIPMEGRVELENPFGTGVRHFVPDRVQDQFWKDTC